MPKVNLSTIERLMIAAVCTLGKSAIDDAYSAINTDSTADDETRHRMALRWFRGEKVQTYYKELQTIHQDPMTTPDEDTEDEPLTRSYLLRELRKSLKLTNDPKDRAAITMKLADLSGLKAPKEEVKEMRHYFIPYTGHCKTCMIMGIFKELHDNKKISDDDFDAIAQRGIVSMLKSARQRQAEARARINAGVSAYESEKNKEDVAMIFRNLLSHEDVADISDYFRRTKEGCSTSKPYWKEV